MISIKDIYDFGRDLAKDKVAISKIKKAIKLEITLNLKYLNDFSKENFRPDNKEALRLISKLKVSAIETVNNSTFPTNVLSKNKVTKEMIGKLPAIRTLGDDLETLLDKLYLMITYLKEDFDKEGLNLFVRLKNIFNYSKIAMRLLEKK